MKSIKKSPPKKKQSVDGQARTPMDIALKFLTARSRTVREVERHLDEHQFGEFEVQQVVDRLQALSYLDDQAYADEFVRSRLSTKPLSRNKLKGQLLQHELPSSVIEQALSAIDDETEWKNAKSIAEKYARQLSRYEEEELRERLMQRMIARGFSYDIARRAIDEAIHTPE